MADQVEEVPMRNKEDLDSLRAQKKERTYQGIVSSEIRHSPSFEAAQVTLPDRVRTFEVFATKDGTPIAVFQTGSEKKGKIPKKAIPFPKSEKGNTWLLMFGSSEDPKDQNRLIFKSYPGVSIPSVLGKIVYDPKRQTFKAFVRGDHQTSFGFTELDPEHTMNLRTKYEIERHASSLARPPSQRAGFNKRTV